MYFHKRKRYRRPFSFQFVVSVRPQWLFIYLGLFMTCSVPQIIPPGKNFLRAAQMNMNFATWGHLMMSILPRYSSFTTFSSSLTATPDLFTNSTPRSTVKEHPTSTPLPRLELSGALRGPGEGPVGLKGALFWLFCSDAPVFRLSFEEDRAPPTSPGITTATNDTSPLVLDNTVK